MSQEPEPTWQLYTGDYEKQFYDVMTTTGAEYLRCWPNGGDFFCTTQRAHLVERDVWQIKPCPRDDD